MQLIRPCIEPLILAQFFTGLADLVRAETPLTECFRILAQYTEDRQLASVIVELQNSAQAGLSLSDSFEKHALGENEIGSSLWRDARTSEQMYSVLMVMAEEQAHLALIQSIRRKIWFWPLVYLSFAGLFMVVLLVFVLPEFQNFYEGFDSPLPLPTQMILLLGPFALLLCVILVVLGSGIVRITHPRFVVLKDRVMRFMPVLGALRTKMIVHQYLRMLSLLLLRKIPPEQAVTLAARSLSSRRIAEAVEQAKLSGDLGLLDALRAINLVPQRFLQQIDIAERTQTLDATLRSAVDTYGSAMVDDMLRYQDQIELLFKLVIGVVFALIAIAVYMPIFRMGAVS